MKPELANVKACVFDTFGTVVDWRSSMIAEAASWAKAKGLNINWVEFTDRWRLGYEPAMGKVRNGEIPWTNLDDLNRMILEDLLKQCSVVRLYNNLKDRGDCQTTRKSYKTWIFVVWNKFHELRTAHIRFPEPLSG